jgi:hypothetical protein
MSKIRLDAADRVLHDAANAEADAVTIDLQDTRDNARLAYTVARKSRDDAYYVAWRDAHRAVLQAFGGDMTPTARHDAATVASSNATANLLDASNDAHTLYVVARDAFEEAHDDTYNKAIDTLKDKDASTD